MDKDKRLKEAFLWERLTEGENGSCSDGRGEAVLSKSLIQFSVDGWSCISSLLFTWDEIMVEVLKVMVTFSKRSHACTATLTTPNPAAGHHRPTPPLQTSGHTWASLGQSLVGSLLLAPESWCTQVSVYAFQESIFPVLCKFWQLHGGINGNLLQEGLCHTQVCCTQSPCTCGSPLLTHNSTADAQMPFCLCGVSGSWCVEGLFEFYEHLWWEWGLILNTNSPLLPSYWGLSLALRHGVSPQSCSITAQPPLQCLPSCWGFSDLGRGVNNSGMNNST